jgi:hypothetical protein
VSCSGKKSHWVNFIDCTTATSDAWMEQAGTWYIKWIFSSKKNMKNEEKYALRINYTCSGLLLFPSSSDSDYRTYFSCLDATTSPSSPDLVFLLLFCYFSVSLCVPQPRKEL